MYFIFYVSCWYANLFSMITMNFSDKMANGVNGYASWFLSFSLSFFSVFHLEFFVIIECVLSSLQTHA